MIEITEQILELSLFNLRPTHFSYANKHFSQKLRKKEKIQIFSGFFTDRINVKNGRTGYIKKAF